jgi:hypothetical protein
MAEANSWRAKAARDAMGMSLEELVVFAAGREGATGEDTFRVGIAKVEFERRVTDAQIKSATWMRWSVVAIVVVGFVSAVVQTLAWLGPHTPK